MELRMTPSEDQLLKARINQYSEEYGIPVVTFNADLEDTKRLMFCGPGYISVRPCGGRPDE